MGFFKESKKLQLPCRICGVDMEFVVDRMEGAREYHTLDHLWNCECWLTNSDAHDLMDSAMDLGIADLDAEEKKNKLYWVVLQGYLLYRTHFKQKWSSFRYHLKCWNEARVKTKRSRRFARWEEKSLERWGGRK